jgi:hypothetical protein
MQAVTTIGLDLSGHGADAAGQVFIRRQLKRRQVLAVLEKLQSEPSEVAGRCRLLDANADIDAWRPPLEVLCCNDTQQGTHRCVGGTSLQ